MRPLGQWLWGPLLCRSRTGRSGRGRQKLTASNPHHGPQPEALDPVVPNPVYEQEGVRLKDPAYRGMAVEQIPDAGGDKVVAVVTQRGQMAGSVADVGQRYGIVYTVENRQIRRGQPYITAEEALDAAVGVASFASGFAGPSPPSLLVGRKETVAEASSE